MRRIDRPDTRKRLTRRPELDKENSRVAGGVHTRKPYAASRIQKAVDPIKDMESGQAIEIPMFIPGFGATALAVVFSETINRVSGAKFRALRSSGRRHARALRRVANCLLGIVCK